jgi:hypothetical protein
MKKSFVAAISYLVLGLLAGVFDREFSKAHAWPDSKFTQLSVVHTHLLTLGFLLFLIVLALDKAFGLSSDARFGTFFAVYNLGLLVSAAMMTWHGVFTVLGGSDSAWPEFFSLIAGMGHLLLGLGLALLLLVLGPKVWAEGNSSSAH